MARRKPGEKPPDQWRCLVGGCPQEGVWQDIVEGEEFLADTNDPRSHYRREHYPQTEARYLRRIAEQRERRMAHYRKTGEFLPPEV